MKKKLLSILLVLCMVLGMMPAALAADASTYKIKVNPSIHGTVIVQSSAAAGETVSVTLVPDEGYERETISAKDGDGYELMSWVEGNEYELVMPATDIEINTTFRKSVSGLEHKVIIDPSIKNGTVDADHTAAKYHDLVKVHATADPGYTLTKVYGTSASGEDAGVTRFPDPDPRYPYYTFYMPDEDVTLSTIFTQLDYTVAVEGNVEDHGTITIDGGLDQTYHYNDVVSFTVIPKPGYVVDTLECHQDDFLGPHVYTIDNYDPATGKASFHMPGGVWTSTYIYVSYKPVTEVPATAIALDPTNLTLISGGEGQALTLTRTPENATGTPSFTSSDPSVAAVDVSGFVTPVSTGTAVITATLGGQSAVCTVSVICSAESCKSYTDVPSGKWYHAAIDYVTDHGFMKGTGTGTFSPDKTLTRAQLAQILYNMEKPGTVAAEKSFTDVSAGKWYYQAVMWAAENGIVTGYGDGSFAPDRSVTREQMVTMIYRYVKSKGLPTSEVTDAWTSFSDSQSVQSWAQDAVAWGVSYGIINGMQGGLLAPQNTATRGQIAKIIMVMSSYYGLT